MVHVSSPPTANDLRVLLATVTDILCAGREDDVTVSACAFRVIEQYWKARADGAAEVRLLCIFGEYRNSDEIANRFSRKIDQRLA